MHFSTNQKSKFRGPCNEPRLATLYVTINSWTFQVC